MKKIFPIFLVLIIFINSFMPQYVFGAAAPEDPPELPKEYLEKYCKNKTERQCFELINDDLKNKKIKVKVPKRAPVAPGAFGVATTIVSTILMATPQGEAVHDFAMEKIEELDLYLYHKWKPHEEKILEAIQNARLHGDLYNALMAAYGEFPEILESEERLMKFHPNLYQMVFDAYPEVLSYQNRQAIYPREKYKDQFFMWYVNYEDEQYILGYSLFGINPDHPKGLSHGGRPKYSYHNTLESALNYMKQKKTEENFKPTTWTEFYKYNNLHHDYFNDTTLNKDAENVILPNVDPNHFPDLPGSRLYHPKEIGLTEVDGRKYIEIEIEADPNISPVPSELPNPWLVPISPLEDEKPIPVFPNVPDPSPNPNPDPSPDPNPDPSPDPNPDPSPDPNPEPSPDPSPEPSTPQIPRAPEDEFGEGKECGELELDLKSIEMFTTKFPFSIPWDIFRAIEAAFGKMGSEEPKFVLSFISDDTVLELPEFIKEWVPLVRSIILFLFDVSIIYALYRWFGGAS